MEIEVSIDFPIDEKNQISDHLSRSLEQFENKLLWRKSQKGKVDHFVLREGEEEISLFLLNDANRNEELIDDGLNFLIFFFCYPARRSFCKGCDWINETISISLSPKQLRQKLASTEILIPKFNAIKISKKQKFDEATHCELIFNKDENGIFYHLDPEVLAVLRESSKINPENQNEDFMSKISQICKRNLVSSIIHNICNNLENYCPKIKKNIKNDREMITDLMNNFCISSDELSADLNSKWQLEQILGDFYP